jgi:zinc protease
MKLLLPFLLLLFALTPGLRAQQADFAIAYEKFTLDNGLEVIFHMDHSDPVVAVALTFHVGSAREVEGRTGFAHLFEHLLFLESENLGRGGLDAMSSRIGGSGANGSTSRDRTNYFQTVPKDALEKMIWAEADKLGFFINTVNEAVLEKEKQVVKNEKRQGVDNAPYGHTSYVISKNLYPAGHPYSWQVIGSLDDLQAATLDDVHQFYRTWYVPNNATLVLAGDFDPQQARAWIHHYFDEIPRGGPISPMPKMPVSVAETRKFYHEDNFARLPELRLTWPGVPFYHPDSYALQILSQLLSDGKSAPFTQVLVDEKQLAPGVNMFSSNSELAGEVGIRVRAFGGTDLNSVEAAIFEALQRFETNGITERDLQRVKAGIETSFYNGLSSVIGKAFQLAQYNIFAGNPGYINEDIRRTLVVTTDDVMRVYRQYIQGKHYIATSFVPRGQSNLALTGSIQAEVAIEPIVESGEGEQFELPPDTEFVRTPSQINRSVEPPYGPAPQIPTPSVWTRTLPNGISVYGIVSDELPLVQFTLRITGGILGETPGQTGVANLLASIMTRGTASRTTAELEEAIELLGATIRVNAGVQYFTISGSSLARNFDATMALVTEMLTQPRWDEQELELARQSVLSQITQQRSNPNTIALMMFNRQLYGDGHILAESVLGSEERVSTISMTDLQSYYNDFIKPSAAVLHVVGAVSSDGALSSSRALVSSWTGTARTIPAVPPIVARETSAVYFYDVPNASQSVLRIGKVGPAETDPDFYPARVMNYKLGGGGFASRLTQELREGRGYTYGVGSSFSGSTLPGVFTISTGVRTNVTYEATDVIRQILADYPQTFSQTDLADTKSFLLKSNARAFETLGEKLQIVETMSRYGWTAGYLAEQQRTVENMSIERIQELARRYANPNQMMYLIVGDARTQLQRMRDLGFGDPILLNP